MPTEVDVINVSKRYSKASDSGGVFDITTTIPGGQFTTLLGESGSGKTTLLRLLAGFLRPSVGSIAMSGSVVASDSAFVPTQNRDLAMVFQSYALWPHMSVFHNVAFGLKAQKLPRAVIEERVRASLDLVGLGHLDARKPGELSGGQQQRVALARSLVLEPGLLLLDEPLSNLDADLRLQMRNQLKSLQIKTGITFVYVTHDQEEAFALSDHMIVLDRGRILQEGDATDLYQRPNGRRVARFMGRGGLQVSGSVAHKDINGIEFQCREEAGPSGPSGSSPASLGHMPHYDPAIEVGSSAHLVVHSEELSLTGADDPPKTSQGRVHGVIEAINFAGREHHLDVRLTDGSIATVYEPLDHGWAVHAPVQISFERSAAWVFRTDATTDAGRGRSEPA